MKKHFWGITWQIVILSLIISSLHLLLVLQLIPVFESTDVRSELVNFIVFPGNFLFEDVLGITSNSFFDALTWVVHVLYGYVIACVLRREWYVIYDGLS